MSNYNVTIHIDQNLALIPTRQLYKDAHRLARVILHARLHRENLGLDGKILAQEFIQLYERMLHDYFCIELARRTAGLRRPGEIFSFLMCKPLTRRRMSPAEFRRRHRGEKSRIIAATMYFGAGGKQPRDYTREMRTYWTHKERI